MTAKPRTSAGLKVKLQAHAAAMRHGHPSRKMKVILVTGPDGARGTVAFLAAILRASGEKVGVITQHYIEIATERVEGSDQAEVTADAQKLQALLAQMKRAHCAYAVIEVPAELPRHRFVGVRPVMVVVRRCGDDYVDQATTFARLAMVKAILVRKPEYTVFNRDDPCGTDIARMTGQEGVMSFGTHHKADCHIDNVQLHPKGSAVNLTIDHQTEVPLVTRAAGKQAIYNATAAAAAAYILHVPLTAIEDGIAALPGLAAQLEYIPIQRPYHIVLDAAVTPGGLAETAETLQHFAKNRLIAVYGAPLGAPPIWLPLCGEIMSRFADRLVVTDGEYNTEQSAVQLRQEVLQGVLTIGGEAKTEEIADRAAAIEKAVSIARRGDVIVVASTTLRPYRQLGTQRMHWSDRKVIEELFS